MKHRLNPAKLFDIKIIKFLSTGVLNTVFGYFVYAILLAINLPYLVALFAATIAGVIFNYFSFGKIVFRNISGWPVFIRYLIAYTLIYTINAALLGLLTEYFMINPYIGQVLCIPTGVLLSWLLMNYWVYKND